MSEPSKPGRFLWKLLATYALVSFGVLMLFLFWMLGSGIYQSVVCEVWTWEDIAIVVLSVGLTVGAFLVVLGSD